MWLNKKNELLSRLNFVQIRIFYLTNLQMKRE